MQLGKFTKTENEKKLYSVDYTEWLADGETVVSATFAVTPTTTSPLVVPESSVDNDGKGIQFYVSGGLDAKRYELTIQVTTSVTQIKEDTVLFAVKNP